MNTRLRRTGTLLVLALLLALMTTGNLSICDALILGEPTNDGPTITVSVNAGQTALAFTEASGIYFTFAVCPYGSLPSGSYLRFNRDTGLGAVVMDLVTSPSTPPGHYTTTYVQTTQQLFYQDFHSGTLDLTVLPAGVSLTACFYAYSVGEINYANQPIGFYADCSTAPESNPIVQYKWWWNYNGNPNSAPDQTATSTPIDHTYTTPGTKIVRLVVKAQDGSESAVIHNVNVVGS
ncbi:MAG TPA: PKD domain-containing protein [Candidatus Krumholzibacteria bacterium]|nr:PKD domain-containing protein [Candidatus Krumholzibacteria bacterium]